MSLRGLAQAAMLLLGCVAATGASAQLPDWSGQWENVGATPDATGGFNQTLEQVLKNMQWGPPHKPEVQAKVDQIVALERKRLEAVARGEDPGGAVRACTFGYPIVMLDSPLMFEILPTPKDDLWSTPWGDSIGHWEGQTLVIDTIAVKSPFASSDEEGVAVMAFGDVEGEQTIAILSAKAHFIERIRMIDKDHLEDQMTVIDPDNLSKPWHVKRTYERVTHINRMVYEDCEGEERNPIVNGHFTLAPPPSSTPQPAPAPNNAPPAQSPPQ